MADLTVSSAVDTFMAAANQAAMLSALNITLGGAFTTSGSFTTTLTVTGNTNVTLPTSGTLAILGANIFTNVQTLPSGTAGAPSLNFGDTTSGLYRSAADRVAIATAGAIRMEIGIIAGVGTCSLYTSSGNSAYLGTGGSNTAMLGNSSNNSSLCGFWNVSAATGRLSSTNRAYPLAFGGDVILLGKAAAVLQLGSDAAGVINQMLTAASRITSDGVGANLTLSGGNGRGGAGGSLILATYDTQGAGTIGNLVTRLTIDTAGLTTFTSAANTGVISATGYSLTGSNATSMIDLAGTWNTSGTPTAFKLNITNTASNVASKLIDLQVGGVSAMSLTAITLPVMTIGNASFHTLDIGGIGIIKCNYGGGERGRITFAENVFNIQMMAGTTGDYGVAITNSSLNGGYLSSDIRLNTTVGVFKIEPNPRQSAGAYTGSGHTLLLKGGQAQTTSTGSSGGLVSIIGGAAGGSGNNNGGNVELSGGTSTGSGTIGCIKFGLATNQLIGFWNKTPIVQPTTGITAAAFIANTSGTINDSATFGGYTIGQIAAALINTGILA